MIRRLLRAIARRRNKPCPRCLGTGSEIMNVEPDGVVLVNICVLCFGTGKA